MQTQLRVLRDAEILLAKSGVKDPSEYNFNCFLLTADLDRIDQDPNSAEHTGLTKKIKGSLDEHKLIMKNQIKVLRKEIDELVELSSTNTKKEFKDMLSESKAEIISEIKRMEVRQAAASKGEVAELEESD